MTRSNYLLKTKATLKAHQEKSSAFNSETSFRFVAYEDHAFHDSFVDAHA